MALTEEQRATHHLYVGGSTIAKIVGVHPRENICDAFLYATGQLNEGKGNEAINRGVALEGYVLDMFEKETEIEIVRDIQLRSEIGEDGRGFAANLDAAIPIWNGKDVVVRYEAPVEAKTSNDPASNAYDEVPIHVNLQVQWEMMMIGEHCRYGLVPVWLANFGRFKFQIFRVERDDSLIEELRFHAFDFLDHVRREVMPADETPHLETLKRVRREPDSVISLDDEAEAQWLAREAAGEEIKHWTATKDQASARLIAMLGTAEAGRLPSGDEIRYMEQNTARHIDLDVLGFRAPELYKEMVTQGKCRVLRRAKAKIGKAKRR